MLGMASSLRLSLQPSASARAMFYTMVPCRTQCFMLLLLLLFLFVLLLVHHSAMQSCMFNAVIVATLSLCPISGAAFPALSCLDVRGTHISRHFLQPLQSETSYTLL